MKWKGEPKLPGIARTQEVGADLQVLLQVRSQPVYALFPASQEWRHKVDAECGLGSPGEIKCESRM